MPNYLVTWEIEVEADNPQHAALIAQQCQRDPHTSANFFTVVECKEKTEIDLSARYQHNCKDCTFLGPHRSEEFMGASPTDYDLYFCLQGGNMPTVLARFSDKGPDYASGLHSSLPWLKEAEKRAKERKLLPFKKK